jgi:aerobic C4-dicarboxylate transport protein
MLAATISSLGLIPVAGVMLVFGVDRFMSECRAVVNVLGNAVAGLVVSRWQGEIQPAQVGAIMSGTEPGVLAEGPERAIEDGAVGIGRPDEGLPVDAGQARVVAETA